jgi:hypothetical protein
MPLFSSTSFWTKTSSAALASGDFGAVELELGLVVPQGFLEKELPLGGLPDFLYFAVHALDLLLLFGDERADGGQTFVMLLDPLLVFFDGGFDPLDFLVDGGVFLAHILLGGAARDEKKADEDGQPDEKNEMVSFHCLIPPGDRPSGFSLFIL